MTGNSIIHCLRSTMKPKSKQKPRKTNPQQRKRIKLRLQIKSNNSEMWKSTIKGPRKINPRGWWSTFANVGIHHQPHHPPKSDRSTCPKKAHLWAAQKSSPRAINDTHPTTNPHSQTENHSKDTVTSKMSTKSIQKGNQKLMKSSISAPSGLLFGPHHTLKLITLIKVIEKLCGVKKATPKSFSITSLNNWINQGSVFTCNNGNIFALVPLHEQINCILKRLRIK